MKERILKLCKRLNKFSQADIETISGLKPYEILPILYELVSEKKLININDIYFYQKSNNQITKKKCLLNLEAQPKAIIELIIKSFCADISVMKTALITELSRNTINNYYSAFRNLLYENQKQELFILHTLNPKLPSVHTLLKQKIYLYYYNGKIYMADKPLETTEDVKKHTTEETKIIHKQYCKVRTVFHNHNFISSFIQIAYEKVWFQNEDYNQKLHELYNLLNINS